MHKPSVVKLLINGMFTLTSLTHQSDLPFQATLNELSLKRKRARPFVSFEHVTIVLSLGSKPTL